MEIAYLGDRFSNSYVAACAFGGDDLKAYPSIRAAVEAVADGKCASAAVPVENSVEGAVSESLDALTDLPLYIAAEYVLPIEYCLVGRRDAKIEDIKRVYSHPQALSQCKRFLRQYGIEGIAVGSTSEGLQRISDVSVGAIARCAHDDQKVLLDRIKDYDTNATRFLLLQREPSLVGNKVTVLFETVNAPGALLNALKVIADCGLNMSHIESRPQKNALGRYIFFVEMAFSGDKAALMGMLEALSKQTTMLKFLGRYSSIEN